MTTPDGQQHQETPTAEPGATVRACERCGTVCAADQEWCLSCGVRMTEMSQRLPGLRAAGMVVALAVLLAGGAAAASYAALQGDARTTAAAPTAPSGTPVTQAPPAVTDPAVTPPVTPTTTPTVPPAVDTTPTTTPDPPKATPTPKVPKTVTPPSTGSSGSGSTGSGSTGSGSSGSGSSGSGSGSGSTGSGKGSSGKGSGKGSGGGSGTTTDKTPTTGPVAFASGQGSLYDPEGVVADRGDEGNAIDGDTSSAWKVTLTDGQTGGFGYVVDFDTATALKSLTIYTPTKGLVVKILGTTKSTLPPDALDLGWDTLAPETTLTDAKQGKTLSLKDVGGSTHKYKHVLVWITSAPGTPAMAQINELKATR